LSLKSGVSAIALKLFVNFCSPAFRSPTQTSG